MMLTRNLSSKGDNNWVQASVADIFLMTNESCYPIKFCFAMAEPDAQVFGHTLAPGQTLLRNGLIGNVYFKSGHPAYLSITD
ncbi:MAG: hypothetical protein MJK10_01175 [Pseudomonadales bacterium]|nr:hypothetical protein [Pseudomonadales bacterium]NRA14487.1 hypothetical protein [Oceanospirillaceae bacterium]